MYKRKVIYIGLLLIVVVIAYITFFSYAFFSQTIEQHGKLNMVVGTLNYKLTSSDLNSNNEITLEAKEKKLIEIDITSLNSIDSKYQLYYSSSNNNFDIGYSSTTIDQSSGTINANATKRVIVSIQNKNNSSITISFGVEGSLSANSVVLPEGLVALNTEFDYVTCNLEPGHVWDFPYNGSTGADGTVQNLLIVCEGSYKLQVWGAQGGANQASTVGGNGGYSEGIVNLKEEDNLYIYAGGKGLKGATSTVLDGGFNGGGSVTSSSNSSSNGGSGGGASDVRINYDSLYARVIVAGGGGAKGYQGTPGVGGGSSGTQGNYSTTQYAYGGTQTTGGTCSGTYSGVCGGSGSFGQGGIGGSASAVSNRKGGAGGGGWYGGAGAHDGSGSNSGSGGGGSGYIYTSSTATNYPNGCQLNSFYYLQSAETKDGTEQFVSPSGTNETGHADNGYVRITYLVGADTPASINVIVDSANVTINVLSYNTIQGYGINQSSTVEPTYTALNTNNPQISWTANQTGTYYVWIKDVNGNVSKKEFVVTEVCQYATNYAWNFPYNGTTNSNGTVQNFTVPCNGNYKLEVWGGQGGNYSGNSTYAGGKGGYSYGNISLTKSTNLYIYAGGKGTSNSTSYSTQNNGGFNGGAKSVYKGGSGGGASDIRIGTDSLYARVIVAGGGGGGAYYNTSTNGIGGYGGGISGGNSLTSSGTDDKTQAGQGGTQTAGGAAGTNTSKKGSPGTFGAGGANVNSTSGYNGFGTGGGGWYGGGAASTQEFGGGGGSGYVYTESTASNYPSGCLLNSSYYLTDAQTIAGNQSFNSPSGTNETGHSDNGYARITYLGN